MRDKSGDDVRIDSTDHVRDRGNETNRQIFSAAQSLTVSKKS